MKKSLLLVCSMLFILAAQASHSRANSLFIPQPAAAFAAEQSQDPEFVCPQRICLRATSYFLINYRRLRFFPRDILISGVNLNHPVEVTSTNTILMALRNPSTAPLAEFNRQYVTAQLSMALTPLFSVYSGVKSSIGCYGLDFQPVKLSTGVTISPASSLETLFSQCDVVAILPPNSEERNEDMRALAQILAKLNGTCR